MLCDNESFIFISSLLYCVFYFYLASLEILTKYTNILDTNVLLYKETKIQGRIFPVSI